MSVSVTLLKSRKVPFVWGEAELEDLECITNDELHSYLEQANLHFRQEGDIISVLYGNCIMHFRSIAKNYYLEVEVIGNNRLNAISKLAQSVKLNAYSLEGDEVHECYDYVIGEWVCNMIHHNHR